MNDLEKTDFEAATEEWDNVQEIIPVFTKNNEENRESQEADLEFRESPLVTIEEFIQDFRQNIDLNNYEENAENSNEHIISSNTSSSFVFNRKLIVSWMKCICIQPRLNPMLEEEKKLVFATSKKQLDNENPLHFQVLNTLYKQFTGSRLDCPRYGSHWEQIGFQVNNFIFRKVGTNYIQQKYIAKMANILFYKLCAFQFC